MALKITKDKGRGGLWTGRAVSRAGPSCRKIKMARPYTDFGPSCSGRAVPKIENHAHARPVPVVPGRAICSGRHRAVHRAELSQVPFFFVFGRINCFIFVSLFILIICLFFY
ncbi:hypothetical protein RND81_11G124900 [Saponaria officinalis]|uniref:Ribosomal protein L2 n=1 Tax=Saponaria officinalis TaxID=3572 RepID=A0AAW1HLQ3_SAPOF